ncbi:MAG: tetratricopeptide repeat protein [Parvibaculaceae bacterium]
MSDESLFREVDEDIRREQLAKLWERFGTLIIAVSLLVILGVAGFKGWQYWQRVQNEAAATRYFEALSLREQGKAAESDAALKEIGVGGHGGFATLARLQEAASLAEQGKAEDAVKAYDAIAADTSIAAEFRDLARIKAGYLVAGTASPEELKTRLQSLDRPDSPWLNAVRELKGTAAYRAGDYVEADRLMNEIIADPNAPQATRQRAQIIVQLLAPLLSKRAEASNEPSGQ